MTNSEEYETDNEIGEETQEETDSINISGRSNKSNQKNEVSFKLSRYRGLSSIVQWQRQSVIRSVGEWI